MTVSLHAAGMGVSMDGSTPSTRRIPATPYGRKDLAHVCRLSIGEVDPFHVRQLFQHASLSIYCKKPFIVGWQLRLIHSLRPSLHITLEVEAAEQEENEDADEDELRDSHWPVPQQHAGTR